MKRITYILLFIFTAFTVGAQDLLAYLDSTEQESNVITTGTFKSVRLINGYTSETAGVNDLVFSISHRFGSVDGGAYELFGLDESNIRFGFEYGIHKRISIAIGRSSYEKLYDGFIKIKLAQQSTGVNSFPFTMTLLEGMAIKSEKWTNTELDYPFSARLYYTHELFIARKFNEKFSAQLVPSFIHRNMVEADSNQNLVPALGIGANYTINNWLSLSGEYYYLFPGNTADSYQNSFSFGVDIESGGGHIFQVHVSSSRGMTEKQFIPETTADWMEGDFRIGFNIIRVFHLKKK